MVLAVDKDRDAQERRQRVFVYCDRSMRTDRKDAHKTI
jgi:hypothetical protein